MKTYIFAIGGTGSRVLKSLTMLLASGVCPNTDEIIPIVIDPDRDAGDYARAKTILDAYKSIHNEIANFAGRNKFFRTNINYNNEDLRIPITDITDDHNRTISFSDYIDKNNMAEKDSVTGQTIPDGNSALASILFSEDNLNAEMTVGFKGNPNMGSVVLNQFIDTPAFHSFVTNFKQGDRIFIISSIFGGTGASGFPLLLKNLRNLPNDMPNATNVKAAKIGGVTVMPYFAVEFKGKGAIKTSTFISKTKAALSYYLKNIYKSPTSQNGMDAIYYLGDFSNTKTFENKEGGTDQQNDAHFIELASALAIIDFIESPDNTFSANTTIEKRYGIKNYDNGSGIYFEDLDTESEQLIAKPLSQFMLFAKYMTHIKYYPKSGANVWNTNGEKDVFYGNSNTKLKGFFDNLKIMFFKYNDWIKEMRDNGIKFHPFNENNDDNNDLFGFINSRIDRKRTFSIPLAKKNWDKMEDSLNKKAKNRTNGTADEFIEIFYLATEELLK